MELKKISQVIEERVLQETLRIIRENKIISIEELAQLKNNSRDVLLIEVGALECLGLVMIKYGKNIKIVYIDSDSGIKRYKQRFLK